MSTTVTVDLFVSVDGWAGGEGLPGYFGYAGPQLQEWVAAQLDQPQVLVMGRRTYEMLADLPDEARDESWQQMSDHPKLVFTRTPTKAAWSNTRIGHDLVEEIRRARSENDVPMRTVGSLSVARQLLDAGLVDRLRLMTFPLLGGDVGREPAFQDVHSADLQLADQHVLDGRILLLEYQPTGKDIPRA